MPNAQLNRPRSIALALQSRLGGRIGLVPFVPAGYPDLETTAAVLRSMDEAGASVIEVGFPFSDPIADGPIIQQAFTAALARKLKVADIFRVVGATRPRLSAPLVAMVSYSIVYRYDPSRFFADARSAGFSGLILPDLPPPEAQSTCEQITAAGLENILLIAPTTAADRRQEIVRLCTGFVYYLSVSGITGARDELPPDLATNLRQIRQLTQLPVCVGFGIHKPQHMADLAKLADGAIVGSAIVKRMMDHATASPREIAQAVGDYCRELLAYK